MPDLINKFRLNTKIAYGCEDLDNNISKPIKETVSTLDTVATIPT
jgi:hypothetical protein